MIYLSLNATLSAFQFGEQAKVKLFVPIVSPSVISRVNPPRTVLEGSTIELMCIPTSGDLPFNFTWINVNGTILSNNATTSVIFRTNGDIERYTCFASNNFGNSNITVEVVKAGKRQCRKGPGACNCMIACKPKIRWGSSC